MLAAQQLEIPGLDEGSKTCLAFSRVTCTAPLCTQVGAVVTSLMSLFGQDMALPRVCSSVRTKVHFGAWAEESGRAGLSPC